MSPKATQPPTRKEASWFSTVPFHLGSVRGPRRPVDKRAGRFHAALPERHSQRWARTAPGPAGTLEGPEELDAVLLKGHQPHGRPVGGQQMRSGLQAASCYTEAKETWRRSDGLASLGAGVTGMALGPRVQPLRDRMGTQDGPQLLRGQLRLVQDCNAATRSADSLARVEGPVAQWK